MIIPEMTPQEVIEEAKRLYKEDGGLQSQDVSQLVLHFEIVAAALYEAEAIFDARYGSAD